MNDFNNDYLVSSGSYKDTMNAAVLPWLESKQTEKTISGFESRPLYTVSYKAENSIGTVFIVHGFTENALKYSELIYSLLHLRFSVVAYDQRGHGRSWRAEGIPDSSVTHVDHFSDYIADLRIILDEYRNIMPGPFFLFAHSMGGAVASLFLEQYPDFFNAAVLSSPMIAPNTGGIPAFIASSVASFAILLGRKKKNPFFMKPYSGPEDFTTSCAADPDRFAWYDEIKAARTEFRNSVPSYGWSRESIRVTDRILAPGAPEKINCPVLLFSAETDFSVLPEPQQQFIDRVPGGERILVRNARHEIFRSTNDVLFPWWHQVLVFYWDHCSLSGSNGGYAE